MRKTLQAIAIYFLVILHNDIWASEYPGIHSVVEPACRAIADQVEPMPTVVAVRDLTKIKWNWRVREAVQTSFASALSDLGWQTIDAEVDKEAAFLAGKQKWAHRELDQWLKLERNQRLMIVEIHRENRATLSAIIRLYRPTESEAEYTTTFEMKPEHVTLPSNIPELNRKILKFVTDNYGRSMGNGECSAIAEEALKQAGGKRHGTYVWGRRLAAHEALLPGDILQFENVTFVTPNGRSKLMFGIHTAVVKQLPTRRSVEILHQNFNGNRTISELTLELKHLRTGELIVYRPTASDKKPRASAPPRKEAGDVTPNREGGLKHRQSLPNSKRNGASRPVAC